MSGINEINKINTQNVEKAKQNLTDLDNELSSAYGLGENGYWKKNSKTYGQSMNQVDEAVSPNPANAHKYAQGTGGVSDYDGGMRNAYGNVGEGIKAEQERKQQAEDAANNGMNHVYGNVREGIKAEQERKDIAANQAQFDAWVQKEYNYERYWGFILFYSCTALFK